MVDKGSVRAFAATWRDTSDQVVATTFGGTMCWMPRKPWRLRIARDGFEHIIRCRECPGCLEFERRRLADRLHAKYNPRNERSRPLSEPSLHNISARKRRNSEAPSKSEHDSRATSPAGDRNAKARLFFVRIYVPIGSQSKLCRNLHRCPRLELEPGMYRLGTNSFGVLCKSRVEIGRALTERGHEHRIEPVRLSRGRRAWRAITAGIAVARIAYGEQVKRWYVRGLPAAEKQSWDIIKMGKGTHYQRTSSPRAWSRANLVLVPPELWRMRRVDRRLLLSHMAKASSPEAAAFVTSLISQVVQARSVQSPVIASSKPRPSREAMMRQFDHVARVAEVASVSEPSSQSNSLPLRGGGYTSSVHTEEPDRAPPAAGERRLGISDADAERLKRDLANAPATNAEWKQKRLERERRLLAEQLESLRQKIMGGK